MLLGASSVQQLREDMAALSVCSLPFDSVGLTRQFNSVRSASSVLVQVFCSVCTVQFSSGAPRTPLTARLQVVPRLTRAVLDEVEHVLGNRPAQSSAVPVATPTRHPNEASGARARTNPSSSTGARLQFSRMNVV